MANSGTSSNLILNIITFNHPEKIKTFEFYKEKTKGAGVLRRHEFPPELKEAVPDADQLYSNFGKGETTELQQEIDLTRSRYFAGHYYNHLLYEAMRGQAHYRRRNFINSNQFWLRDQRADTHGFKSFKKIVVKATVGRYTNSPELRVSYDGQSLALSQSVLAYSGSTNDLNYLLYRGHCFRYDDIPPTQSIDFSKAYPVVNRKILHYLNKTLPPKRTKNKVKTYFKHINDFKDQFILSKDIQALLPAKRDGQWYRVKRNSISQVPKDSDKLVFFNGKTHINPYFGVSDYGPYRRPPAGHIKIFFIMHESDRKEEGARLYHKMAGNVKGVKGLQSFTKMPMNVTQDHIIFKNEADPFPEIAEQLREMPFEDNMRYLAVYVSPISKNEQNDDKYRAYFQIKEELLKYNIASQTIERRNIDDNNFGFYMPNIATAVIAKLGGVPWQLSSPPAPELVVGVGAFKPAALDNRYVGNAFCFSNEGAFYGFECYVKDETTMLAGSIRKAVRTYVKKQGNIERLIIHYYKQMSYKERKPIMQMLYNLGLDIPVVVVSINKTESRDIAVFDSANTERIPVSGLNVRIDGKTHLLCNNTRYKKGDKGLRSYPFPVKLRISSSGNHDSLKGKERARLIRQIYQFSRIYWKSVSQQSLPVTVRYPEMVARMVPYFESLDMPEFAKKSLWFL